MLSNSATVSKISMSKIRNNVVVGSNPAESLPDDLAALFTAAKPTGSEVLSQLESAAAELGKNPKFLADYAKGLIVEDILRAMEDSGITRNALATKIGKSRQYVSKVLDEERRANFTIDSLAEFSTALDLQLCLRMVPASEHMLFIRKLPTPVAIESFEQFPDERADPVMIPDCNQFESRNTIPFTPEDNYEPSRLSA